MTTNNLLAIGNLSLDTVFNVDRIPRLDETGLVHDRETYFGGRAGNIAVICSKLGLKTAVASIVGHDFISSGYEIHLLEHNVNIDRVKMQQTGKCAEIFLFKQPDGKHIYFFRPNVQKNLMLDLEDHDLQSFGVIYVSSFDSENTIKMLLGKNREPLAVFGFGEEIYRKSEKFLRYVVQHSNIICINLRESKIFLERLRLESIKETFHIGRRLRFVCVSRGAEGSTIFTPKRRFHLLAVPPEKCVSTLGAGDAYVAGLIYGLSKEWNVEASARFGSVLSSFILESVGAQNGLPNWQQIKVRYRRFFGEKAFAH